MLRLFFGQFYCNTAYNLDQAFHLFTEGKTAGGADYVHNRLPVGYAYSTYDEYIDLYLASLEVEWPETIVEFIDIMGISHPSMFQDGSFDATVARPSNTRTLETELSEFFRPTYLLSYPVPNPNYYPTPELYVVNQTYENDRTQTITSYRSFTISQDEGIGTGAKVSYSPKRCVVPIVNAATDVLRFHYNIREAGPTGAGCTIYRATIEYNEITKRWLRSNMEREIDTAFLTAETTGWQNETGDFADETAYPYVANSFAPFEPLNDALARTALEFEKNVRYTGVTPCLVLNVDTHLYFKGYIRALSPAFTEGVVHRGNNQAMILFQITEEGKFLDAALTAPNTSSNFTAATRSYLA